MLANDTGGVATTQQQTFKTEKESYAYRIANMLRLLYNKNRQLCNNEYNTAKIASKANWMDRFMVIDSFAERVKTLKERTEENSLELEKMAPQLSQLGYGQLKSFDEKLVLTLNKMHIDHTPKGLDTLTQPIMNMRARNNIEYFENLLKKKAIDMLTVNRGEVKKLKEEYSSLRYNPDSGESDVVWNNFEKAMNLDNELVLKMAEVEDKIGQAKRDSMSVVNIRGPISKEQIDHLADNAKEQRRIIEEGKELLEYLNKCRGLINKEYPVTRLIEGSKGVGIDRAGAYEEIVNACVNAQTAFDGVEKKILNGDMPLCKMSFILEPLLVSEGITADNPSAYSQEVLKWVEDKRRGEFILNILGIVIPLGLAIACFIPGIGVGAVIALGVIGAGVGTGFAAYEFEVADDLNDAASASTSGSQKLVDTEAARAAYIWGAVGLALSAFDIFMSGKAVLTLLKVTKGIHGVANVSNIIKLLDEKTMGRLAKLNADELTKVMNVASEPEDIASILKNIDNVKDLKKVAKIDFNNLKGADIATIRNYPNPPDGYLWAKNGDDVILRNKSGNGQDLIDFDEETMTFFNREVKKFVASGTYKEKLIELRGQLPSDAPIKWKIWDDYPGTKFEEHHWINQAQLTGQNQHELFEKLLQRFPESDIKKYLIDADWNIDKIPHRGGHTKDYYIMVRKRLDYIQDLYDNSMELDDLAELFKDASDEVKINVENGFSLYN